jgi:hypothetical protein
MCPAFLPVIVKVIEISPRRSSLPLADPVVAVGRVGADASAIASTAKAEGITALSIHNGGS